MEAAVSPQAIASSSFPLVLHIITYCGQEGMIVTLIILEIRRSALSKNKMTYFYLLFLDQHIKGLQRGQVVLVHSVHNACLFAKDSGGNEALLKKMVDSREYVLQGIFIIRNQFQQLREMELQNYDELGKEQWLWACSAIISIANICKDRIQTL